MLIVSDTTAITNLWQVGHLHLLKEMYGEVVIPNAVWQELIALPEQADSLSGLDWLQIRHAQDRDMVQDFLHELDLGEAEAIVLSLELKADFLIMDEALGRKKAEGLQIKTIGLLGILLKAKQDGLLKQVRPVLAVLEKDAGFFISPNLYRKVLQMAGEGTGS